MLYCKNGKPVSRIGIGTWTINKQNINDEVDSLLFYFQNGVNYIDVVLAYDNGAVLDVISQFLQKINREDIFINAFITFGCKNPEDIEKQVNFYLNKLNTSYLDCVTLHALDCIGFELSDYTKTINKLHKNGTFLNVGYSNLMPEQLFALKNVRFFEGLYNLENKINEDTKILDYCKQNNIDFYAYQPLRRNRTAKQNYPQVVELANKYNKTQNQILINWMVLHKGIGVIIKSSNKKHIAENIDALNFKLKSNEYKVLDQFRNAEFDKLKVCYKNEEGKIRIDQIPNQPIGIL